MPREWPPSSSGSSATATGTCGGDDYIEHRVSKLDTLAGVAIKYGVEVADVKRANGLATDLHMFGHQTLRIPVHGRHGKRAPPRSLERQEASRSQKTNTSSPITKVPTQSPESSYREKRALSTAMNLLRGYYGLSSPAQFSSCNAEGMELTSYRSEGEDYSEDEPMSPLTPPSTLKGDKGVLSNGRTGKVMSRLSNECYTPESVSVPSFGVGDADKSSEPSVRRRSKVDGMGPLSGPSEMDIKEIKQDTDPPDKVLQTSFLLPIGTDSIGNRTAGFLKVFDGALVGGKSKDEPISQVIKSMSTSNLQDQTSLQANSSGLKYSSKLDAKHTNQTQPISRSLFEGLSKPALPRYKEALD